MNEFKSQLNGLLASLEKLTSSQQREALDILQLTLSHQLHGTPEATEEALAGTSEFSQHTLELNRDKWHETQGVIELKTSSSLQENISNRRLGNTDQQSIIDTEGILSEPQQSDLKKNILPLSHQQDIIKNHSHELHNGSLEEILPQDLEVARTPDQSLISLEPFPEGHAPGLNTVHNSLHSTVDAQAVQCLQQPQRSLAQQTENLTAELETFDRAQKAAAKRNRLQEAAEIASQDTTSFRTSNKLSSENQDSSELESLLHQHEAIGRQILQERDNKHDFPGSEAMNSPGNLFHSDHVRSESLKPTDTIGEAEVTGEKVSIASMYSERTSLFSEQEPYVFNFKLQSEQNSCQDVQYSTCDLPSKKQIEELEAGEYFSSHNMEREGHPADPAQEELVTFGQVENVGAKKTISEVDTPDNDDLNIVINSNIERGKDAENSSSPPSVERRILRKRKCKNYIIDPIQEKKSKRNNDADTGIPKRSQAKTPKRSGGSASRKGNKENSKRQLAQKDNSEKEVAALDLPSGSEVLPVTSSCQETSEDIGSIETKDRPINQSHLGNMPEKKIDSPQPESTTVDPSEPKTDCDGSWPPTLNPVSCRSCKKELANFSLFSVHLRQCEGHLVCSYCSAKFVHKVTYLRHIEGHKRNICTKCPQSFCSHKKLKEHMKVEHNFDLVSKTYPCQFCSRIFLKRFSLYYHLKIHASENEVVCQKCGVFCQGNENFKAHMAEHVKATDFHCHICTASFRRRQQYDDHLKLHKKYNCELCGQPLTTKRALVRHCKLEHKTLPRNIKPEQEYKCDKCDRVFHRPSILRNHLQLHKGVKPLECRLCNKKFSHQRGLRKHMTGVVHEHMLLTNNLQKDHAYDVKQNLAFTCEYCGIKLPTRNMLLKHSRVAHKVGITWTCPHCDYKTQRNFSLKRHMQLHLESRNFMCEVCGSAFHALGTLKDHHKFMHSDERNFKCTKCGKTFKNKSSLARHHHTHSENRPYQCHCGTSYKRLSHLKRHMLSAHDETVKSRITKKFRHVEDVEANSVKQPEGQDTTRSTELSDGEDFEFVDVSGSTISPVIQTVQTSVKDTSDILLPTQESIILMGDNSNSEQSQLITVGDSQIIQLIPSSFQFPQESTFQTVSLVSAGELHTLPLSSAAPYGHVSHNSQVVVEPFSLTQSSETMVMVPTSPVNDPLECTLRTLENEGLVGTSQSVRSTEKHDSKEEMNLHSLPNPSELSMTSNLHTFDYTEPPSSQSLLPTLPPAHYITHSHASTSQISQELLQQNLICSEFVLPVDSDR